MPVSPSDWCSTLRRIALATILVSLAFAFTILRPPATSGPYERDFEAYYAAGATVNAGGDPYSRDIWRAERTIAGVDGARDELLPFVGPAAALPLWSLLARLPQPIALRVWSVVLGLAFAGVLWSALALAHAPREPLTFVGALAFGLSAAPMIGDIALGQVALVSAAALGAALVAFRARHPFAAGAATLIAALQPNLALALLARMRTRWDLALASAAALVFLALTLGAGGGFAGIVAYAHRLSAHGGAERFVTIQHTATSIAYAFHAAPEFALSIGSTLAIGTIALTLGAIVRERLDATTATLLAFAALPLAVPFFHEHDFVLELIPLTMLAARARGTARVLASLASALVLVDWFGLAQRPNAQGQILALGLAVSAAFVVMGAVPRSDRRLGFAGIGCVLGLGLVLGPLAQHAPAPTWPDALPAHYHANPAADASGVWGDEQRLSGLERREPLWGLLRALPLCGCVLLAWALIADARLRAREPDELAPA